MQFTIFALIARDLIQVYMPQADAWQMMIDEMCQSWPGLCDRKRHGVAEHKYLDSFDQAFHGFISGKRVPCDGDPRIVRPQLPGAEFFNNIRPTKSYLRLPMVPAAMNHPNLK